ncbi:methylenetetrahydrofolate--tRNA-(uracil(54)-C(5))-methyltransferase (FADH(2)-oxidizing) TrmFO [Anoxybacter fermentans]|uniref:Methylenetetrahydrofolate--tRNA-(uracil-5-)-methyltransferase TrmFO n=1 Tax=Anoxybacter fermentans TaxID=1323375 RepID=A0A3S9SVR9_9FIRM|nr:methylenetetrahydrofolate--tRNA-(uracil(54)-C(5))-methyltransferase (FADH(2)-oxidizing) TrmFO [Anoxybacter fermentans]AZR72362.1 methylenetetrahydrofolate--tRNA-(uracil(54)-C(5))-methyltransferase (FADH(2)-oxidizing) TrmFO [Anoxybacter fermentans]
MTRIRVIGAGLAGVEAAWQIAKAGVKVELWEMRPLKMTPAHHTGYFAELVCSNSLKADHLANAAGLLKAEMRELDSIVLAAADRHAVPAGQALAVDREKYAKEVTERILNHPNIEFHNGEVTEIFNDGIVIIASGPLTSNPLSDAIQRLIGTDYLYFFDAAAPIVTKESLDHNIVFKASRYGDEENGDYLNCPMTKEEYEAFWHELVNAERAQVKDFEKGKFFEGCLPIEEIASRGIKTLVFGPLKPVGLIDPRTGEMPYAVVQLRQDNLEGTLYNLVGFQTRLKWGEQKRVFSMIPGLSQAEFVRYGVMHRNTYINSPKLLKATLQLKKDPRIFFAGQITGVEGYVESAATGIIAGINALRLLRGEKPLIFPKETAHGALTHYISTSVQKSFQPMNMNFGILPPLKEKIKDKRLKKEKISKRALACLRQFINQNNILT